MMAPSHSKTTSRNRFSLILHFGSSSSSNPGGATLKKKRSKHSPYQGMSSQADVNMVNTPLHESPDISRTPSCTSADPSIAASVSPAGPHTPLLSSFKRSNFSRSNVHIDTAPVPVLASTNDLDAKDKMRLLKKARKLSQALGEVAIPSLPYTSDEKERASNMLDTPQPSPKAVSYDAAPSRAGSTSSRQKIKRSSTYPGMPSPPTSRPSTPLPTDARCTRPAALPLSRPTFSVPSPESPAWSIVDDDPSLGTPAEPYNSVSAAEPQYAGMSLEANDSSRSTTPVGFERGRKGKLGRYLPANLPAELVLRPSTTVGAPSPNFKDPSAISSAPSRHKGKRRLSLDLSALMTTGQSIFLSPTTSEFPKEALHEVYAPAVKRSRSLWVGRGARSGGMVEEWGAGPSQEHDRGLAEDTGSVLTESQRLLNVRRARKMAQLFGSEPPPALFQFTNINNSDHDDDFSKLSPITESNRASISSTLISLSPTDFTPGTPSSMQTTPRERRRPHSIASSIVSVIPPPSPRMPADTLSSELSLPNPPQTPPPFSTHMQPVSPIPVRPTSSHSSRHTARSSSESDIHNTSFRQRRLRAAKLSRFFGVDPQQLEPELQVPWPPAVPTFSRPPLPFRPDLDALHPSSAEQNTKQPERPLSPLPTPPSSSGMKVDVKMVSRPGLFSWGNHEREMDVDDVRVKLRRMKAHA